jgi:hypothetical protein
MSLQLKPSEYGDLLIQCYNSKQPLFVRGGPGIGKSAIPRQVFTKLAKSQGKEYCEWQDLTLDQKMECIKNPDKYFVFGDFRTSQMDTTSLQGVPNMANKEILENIPYSWVVYFTQAKAHGVIFFDEINLAAPIVQSITYSAIHDRVIADRRMGDDVYVFAAGNRQQDKAHTFDMPLPLRDRFAECEMVINADDWVEWAIGNKINPHLIAFIQWRSSYLYKVDVGKDDKPSTPRGVCRASKLIAGREILSDSVHMLVSISCGEAFATEFQAYVKIYKKIDWNHLMKNPQTIKDFSLDQVYAVSGGLAERFQKDPADMKQLEGLFAICEYMRADFTLNTLRMMRDFDRTAFGNGLRKLKKGAEYAQKYGRFMIDLE